MLAQLRIRTVCDYRSPFEREREKTQWPGPQAPKILVLDIMSLNPDMAGKDPSRAFFDRLMKPALPPGILPRSMSESMGTMALTGAPLYGRCCAVCSIAPSRCSSTAAPAKTAPGFPLSF